MSRVSVMCIRKGRPDGVAGKDLCRMAGVGRAKQIGDGGVAETLLLADARAEEEARAGKEAVLVQKLAASWVWEKRRITVSIRCARGSAQAPHP
jgi:hypothetical protein